MMQINRDNLQNFCRTCLEQLNISVSADCNQIEQTSNLSKLLMSIKGDDDGVYPQWICKKCYDTLQHFHHFHEMTLRSAEVLHKIVNDSSDQVTSEGYYHDSECSPNQDVKIEVEPTHMLDDYCVNEKADNINEFVLASELLPSSTSTAKKRKQSNDIDETIECRILGCYEKFKSNKILEAHLKQEHTSSMTEQHTVFNEHDDTCISIDIHDPKAFSVECSKCQSINDFHNNRTDLKTFLKGSFEGILIQSHFDKHKKLDDAMQNNLTQLIISRELLTIVQNQNVTLENPIRKLEISSTILKNLAQEIADNFNERPGIYYSAGIYEGKKKVNPAGKFVQRINYMRRLMVENGLYRKPYK